MIRAMLGVGWLGVVLALVALVTGYRVADEERIREHMTGALFAAGTLLLANLCVAIYLLLTRRLVRRTVAELGLATTWSAEQRRLSGRGAWPALLAAALLVVLFASGFPVYAKSWSPLVHHTLAWAAALAQLAFLVLAAPALRASERHLLALGEEAERVRYTPPPDATPPAAASPPRP